MKKKFLTRCAALVFTVLLVGMTVGCSKNQKQEEPETSDTKTEKQEEEQDLAEEPEKEDHSTEEAEPESRDLPPNILMKDRDCSTANGYIVLGNEDYLRKEIITITFFDTLAGMPDDAWDVSAEQNESVMAWITATDGGYALSIGGEGGVTANEDCCDLFSNYENVETIQFNDCFYTDHVTRMSAMFWWCKKLTNLDLTGFCTKNATQMDGMFGCCESLTNLDVTGFDTSSAVLIDGMFYGCRALTSLDVSNFDTTNVTRMSDLFSACDNLEELDLTSFNTSNVTDMAGMFSNCVNLKEVDVTGFDTSNVKRFLLMFNGCKNLVSVDLSGFDSGNVTDMKKMFKDCSSLQSYGELEIPENAETEDMFAGTSLE